MDKSPLLFWLVNAAWSLFGVSTLAARLVCVAFAAGAVAATSRIAGVLGHRDPASAGWLMLPFVVFGAFSPVVMFDVPLLCFVALGLLGLVQWLHDRRWPRYAFFLVVVAFGLLAKGPVYLLHMAGPILLMRWWHGRPLGHAGRMTKGLLVGLVIAALPLAVWAAVSASRFHGTSIADTLIHQSVGRVAESFDHRRGWYWYIPLLLPFLLPWSLLLRWRQAAAAFHGVSKNKVARLGVAASLPALAGFSLVSGKQVHYLIPLLPGVALLLSAMHERVPAIFALGRVRLLLLLAAVAWAWLAASAVIGLQGNASWYIAAITSATLLLAGASLTMWKAAPERERLMRASCAALLSLVSIVLLLGTHLKARMDPQRLATVVAALQRDGVAVAVTSGEPGLVNYLARLQKPLPVIGEKAAWIESNPQGYALVHASHGRLHPLVNAALVLTDGWAGLVPAADLEQVQPSRRSP
ncbi:ArnT family glycosyltransferase [Luteibacter yeojuensis]